MTVTLSTAVAVPIPKQTLRFTLTASDGNFVRLWCTAAPIGSRLRSNLDKDAATRVHVIDTDSGRDVEYSFEVAGAYQLQADEFRKGAAAYGGGYQGAPDTAPAETLLSSTPITLYVANQLKMAIGHGSDLADLVIHVLSDQVVATSLAAQGVFTPAVQKPRGPKAATAATSADVLAAVASLAGQDAGTVVGDLSALATSAVDRFNAHIASGTFHAIADSSSNKIAPEFRNPNSPEALKRTVGALLKALAAHIRNDSVIAPQGIGSSQWHKIAGLGLVDWPSVPLFESTSSISEHVRGLADFCRAFEAHRGSSAHTNPDETNGLGTLPQLITVHGLFLNAIAASNPVAPVTENSAKTTLVHGAGFEEN